MIWNIYKILLSSLYYAIHSMSGLVKKMEALGREKDCQDINEWIKSISNHLYWCAASSKTSNEILAKWKSVVNHIQNIHIHKDPLFPVCLHDASLRRKYLKPSMYHKYITVELTSLLVYQEIFSACNSITEAFVIFRYQIL